MKNLHTWEAGENLSLHNWENKSEQNCESLKTEGKLALRMSSMSLAAGIWESILKGNKLLIKTQYLQWPLSNSRCTHGDFSTNNKESPATRSDSWTGLQKARITWDTEKRLSRNETTQK